jgi:hypothetical protein
MLSILKKDKGIIIPIVKVFFPDVQNEACSYSHKGLIVPNLWRSKKWKWSSQLFFLILYQCTLYCSARDWDGKDYLRIIPRVVW